MSDSIANFLSAVNYDNSWAPDQDLMIKIFSAVSELVFSGDSFSYQSRDENAPLHRMMMDKNIIAWFWGNFPNNREKFLEKLMRLYNHNRYDYSSRTSVSTLDPESKEFLIKVFTDSFDAIPDSSDSINDLTLKIHLSSMPINRKIDYTAKMMEAALSGDRSMVDFWNRMGMDRSKDPAFYSMAWAKIERSQGYTDRRSNVIRAASKCQDYPESIINDLINAGHNKNRSALISIFVDRISELNNKKNNSAYRNIPSVQSACDDDIRYCQSVLAKFVGCEDIYIMQQLIPHLRRDDLIFAAPTAAKLGLQRLLDRHMNGSEVESRSYRY